MPPIAPSVRVAATSILLLSLVHILFWGMLAVTLGPELPPTFPYNYVNAVLWAVSGAGLLGILVSIGIFRARNWGRIAAIALGAIVAFFCVFGMLVPILILSGLGLGIDLPVTSKSDLLRLFLVYFFVFSIALWWIFLFSKKSVAVQFSANEPHSGPVTPQEPTCPPPIALLAWLMIATSALSALSWPLILGRIPAMLFTHIFYAPASNWIWAINLIVFLACGIGLLKLQRWSYTGAIAIHIFWLVSLLVTQLSPQYNRYMQICLAALELPGNYPGLNLVHFPQWLSAIATAIPTLLLIAGLFYYRPSFRKAVADSRHLSA